jgi:hypothetical protein
MTMAHNLRPEKLIGSPSIYSRATAPFLSVTAHTGISPHAKLT